MSGSTVVQHLFLYNKNLKFYRWGTQSPLNCPQPYAKNCRAGIQTKVSDTRAFPLSLHWAVLPMSFSMETAKEPCRRHGTLSYGQAVELVEPSGKNVDYCHLVSLHLYHSFPFQKSVNSQISFHSRFPLLIYHSFVFPLKQNQVVQFHQCLLGSCWGPPCATCCAQWNRASCSLRTHGAHEAHGPAPREDGHRGKVKEQAVWLRSSTILLWESICTTLPIVWQHNVPWNRLFIF